MKNLGKVSCTCCTRRRDFILFLIVGV